jgi:hypothetical protein
MFSVSGMTLKIDLSEEDGKPHWLARPKPTRDEIRKKYRDAWLDRQKRARLREAAEW